MYSIFIILSTDIPRFAGESWMLLLNPESLALWELRVRFNLTERADTGRVNTSPSTVFFPGILLQLECNHTIWIPGKVSQWVKADLNLCSTSCFDVCSEKPQIFMKSWDLFTMYHSSQY